MLLEAGECGLAVAASRCKSRTVAGGEGPEFPAIPLRAKFSAAVADDTAAGGLVFGWYELKYD